MLPWPATGGSGYAQRKDQRSYACSSQDALRENYSFRSVARILEFFPKPVRKFLENPATEAHQVASWVDRVNLDYIRKEVYANETTINRSTWRSRRR